MKSPVLVLPAPNAHPHFHLPHDPSADGTIKHPQQRDRPMTNDRAPSSATPRRAVAYLRVSTQQQADDGALGVQFDKVHPWAQNNGYQIVLTMQEVQHGTLTSQVDRPVFHECLRIAKGDDLVIIALSPSRISRNLEHARRIDDENPGRFVFVEQEIGYEGQPWPIEVAEKHALLPSTIANGTAVAMHSLQRKGLLRGAPDGGKAGRAASEKVRSTKKHSLTEQTAGLLESNPAWQKMTRRELVPLLTAAGIKTTRGEVFTTNRITRPLQEARTVLLTRRAATQILAPYRPLSGAGEAFGDVPVHAVPMPGSVTIRVTFPDGAPKLETEVQTVKTTVSAAHDGESSPGPIIDLTGLSQKDIDDAEMKDNPIWGMFG